MLKISLLIFALWVVPCLQTCPTNFDISNKKRPMRKIFLLMFALWVVPCLQTCPTNFDISNKNGPYLRYPLNFCPVGGTLFADMPTNFDISNKNGP